MNENHDAKTCIGCDGGPCRELGAAPLPKHCPLKGRENLAIRAKELYLGDAETKRMYVGAALVEKRSYEKVRGRTMAIRPRIEELVDYARTIGADRIGIAYCIGLANEASLISGYLSKNGLDVQAVKCHCGHFDKCDLGVPKEGKIGDPEKFESACNPILQAMLLNELKTGLNVIVGLCIGHDVLFTEHSKAPVTTLVVKDRVTGHNPLAAVHSAYHRPFDQITL